MVRLFQKTKKPPGSVPGMLVSSSKKNKEKVKITVIDYDKNKFQEKQVETIKESYSYLKKPTITWINIDGVYDIEIIKEIGEHFKIHPLVQEDIMNVEQRSKLEDYGDYMYVVLKMIYFDENETDLLDEQISLILGKNFVISFQEKEGDVFQPIRERLKHAKGKIRTLGSDYLSYTLIDAIVDNYFVMLEKLGEKIEHLETQLMENGSMEALSTIHKLKRDGIFLRKAIWPLREVISSLLRDDYKFVKNSTKLYFRDVYDHCIQVIDTIESLRDLLFGMLDLYLSTTSNKMNEVMKVLTIIATIFIPLTFIAGIYGMNFSNMPELDWPWAYGTVWVIMIIMASIMLALFKKKGWL